MVTTRRWTQWTALLCFLLVSLHASAYNRLSIPDVLMEKGGSIDLPVNLENDDQVVALQFTLTVPDGFTLDVSSARLTERSADHMLRVKNVQGNDYLCMVYSVNNTELSGNRGAVMYVKLKAPTSVNEGDEFPMTMTEAVASDVDMNNVLDASSAGTITIARFPDLVPANVTTDKRQYAPGDHIVVSWTVQNDGQLSTGGGWSEQISLVDESGTVCMLGTTYYNDILGPGGIVSRQADIVIPPVPGIHGNVIPQVRIVPNSDCGERPEAQGNNTIQGTGVQLDAELYLDLSKYTVEEAAARPLTAIVTRSGNREEDLTVSLTSNDSRVSLPATATIAAGQSSVSIPVTLLDNDVVDDSDKATITANASGYPRVDAILTIEDNEFPQLTANASVRELTEGEAFTVTVTTTKAPNTDLTVNVSCSLPGRFEYPATMTIKAGETSATTEFVAVEDNLPDVDQEITFTFTADKYESDELWITLHDNDVPDIELTLTPATVSEGAGTNAVIATLKRLNHPDNAITVMLSEDSNGLLSFSTQQVTMAAGVSEVQFAISLNDNKIVDGDRLVNVTAAIYIKSCSCQAQGGQAGYVTQQLTVTDNDGPTVTITSSRSTIAEGSEATLTITRNANIDEPLTITLSSNNDSGLNYSHEVTIPAGELSTQVIITVDNNEQLNDDHLVTLQASADGFSTGTCWIMITNQTLPDAQVTAIELSKQQVEVGEEVEVTVTVANTGSATLPAQVRTIVYLDDDTELARMFTMTALEPGEAQTMSKTFAAPDKLGSHQVYAVVNDRLTVHEQITGNNTSSKVDFTIGAPFSATLNVDKSIYESGETVVFSGTVTGNYVAGDLVEIYIINNGSRQTLNATIDESGNFTAQYTPLAAQIGHFIAGACYPGENASVEMTKFDIYGISAKSKKDGNRYETCELALNETYSGTIVVTNPGILPQTGLSLITKAQSPNCEFNFDVPTDIPAGGTTEINYTIHGNAVSEGVNWQQMPIEITTAEGSRLNYSIYYYVHPLTAKLKANVSHINTTMTFGEARSYPISITNVGKGETGKITLALPSWIQTATPSVMASLSQGDSADIVLRFIPTADMKLNVPVTGRIGINCENGDGTYITFQLIPVSEVNGTFTVDAVDEFTFFTAEAPHVSGAAVTIKRPHTGEIIAQGVTDTNGKFTVEIPEGWYTLTVTANKHNSYNNTIIVDPGVEKTEEAFLSYQTVTYSWDVAETTVEDEYETTLVATYETRVPKPVVVITLPDERPEPYTIFPILFTNKGLMKAVNVRMSLNVSDGYTVEILNDTYLDSLEAQQEYTMFARIIPTEDEESSGAGKLKANRGKVCYTIIAKALYQELCKKYTADEMAEAIKKWGERHCYYTGGGTGGGYGGGGYGGGGWGPGGGPGGGGGGSYYGDYYTIYDTDDPAMYCDPPKLGPDSIDCDKLDEEEPLLIYKLISAKKGKDRIGVAADGLSQVKIVLDSGSRIPRSECSDSYTYQWRLEPNLGKLSDYSSIEGIIYTAPDNFPNLYESTTTIKAIMTYTKNSTGKRDSVVVPIKVCRVPVALIHGLNSNRGCWQKFNNRLLSTGLYESWQINNVDYSSTHNSSFATNYGVASKAIHDLKFDAIYQGYEVTQVDLIGHSMGGILSRFHVQQNGKNVQLPNGESISDVHKLITVNTPHAGSELGDMAVWDPAFAGALIIAGFRPIDAVKDLAVNSSAIDRDLNDTTRSNDYGVPVHAVITTSPLKTFGVGTLLATIGKLVTLYNHGAEYALYLGNSDAIVSKESQEGGCSNLSPFSGLMHTESPDASNVWARLTALLCASTEGNFSTAWFRPQNRTFIPIPIIVKNNSGSIKDGNLNVEIEAVVNNDSLYVSVDKSGLFREHMVIADFGDGNVLASDTTSLSCLIPSTFTGNIRIVAFCKSEDGSIAIDSTFVNVSQSRAQLQFITADDVTVMVGDTATVTVTGIWDDGSETTIIPDQVTVDSSLANYSNGHVIGVKSGISNATFIYQGFTCASKLYVYNEDYEIDDEEEEGDNSESVCSTVTLSFKQRAVMTRQAFRGTLTINNGHDNAALENLVLNLTVRDEDGNLATSHEFQINCESLEGFTGKVSLDSCWTLDASTTGIATILFIPTKYAAPTEPKNYSFGGSFSYTDPSTGLTVTRELNPVTLTVSPSPNLVLDYFLQRDVFGDDPLTEEVEPMQDAEFALIIDNQGYGDANNFKMITQQPQIIENEKGLLIDFEFVSSQLNGEEANLSMGGEIPTNFGTIEAQSQAYAQWWLRSSLLGHFISYDVSYNHVTSYGNEDLSLLDTVRVHELIHGFTTDDVLGNRMRGFLTNDMPDADDKPDIIHFTNATEEAVAMSNATLNRISDTEYLLEVTAGGPGWNYGSVIDPTVGRQKVVSVVRQSDGKTIYADNVWTTDRTLIDGADWLYENRLHYVVEISGMTDSYLITFEPKPETELEVESFDGLPDESVYISDPITNVTVTFNKPVDASTFTTDDITLTCDGKPLNASLIGITPLSDKSFDLDLSQLTYANGYYVLTVQAAGVKDTEGFNGSSGKHVTWTQYMGGVAHLEVSVEPEGAGLAVPGSGDYPVNSTLHMRAQANAGYTFLYWMSGEEIISRDAEFDYQLLGDAQLTAVFQTTSCFVEITYDEAYGTVVGGISQVCDYGTVLELTAVPADGYEFCYWLVNGQFYSENPEMSITIEEDMTIEAIFKEVGAPDITLPPVLNYDEETMTLTVQGNGEIHVYVDGVEVNMPYTFEQTDEEVTYTVTATAQEPGKEISETATITVTVPAKTVVPEVTEAPVLSYDEETMTLTVQGNGEIHVYVDGVEVNMPYTFEQTDEEVTYTVTATAQEPGKEISETATLVITVPGKVTPPEPEVTESPAITLVEVALEYVVIHVEGQGTITVWVNGDEVTLDQNGNYVLFADTEEDMTYVVTATAQEPGKLVSEPTEFTISVPAYNDDTKLNEMNADKSIVRMRYFNMAGQEMQQIDGITLVVTTYSDGTSSVVKVMK